MRRVFVLALPLAVANNVFNSLSLEEARRHCPMPPNRMHEDVRSCTARLMVVVPCYGQEKTVMHSLRSIWAQACVKDVVVFDDDPQRGHTCARRLLSDSEASSRQVEVVRNPYNLGLAGVRNAGLELAAERGHEFISFLDADDAYGHGYFYAAMERVESSGESYDLITADQVIVSVAASDLDVIRSASRWVIKQPTLEGLRHDGMLPIPNLLRVDFMRHRVGGFVEENVLGMEDYATWIRALEARARVLKLPTPQVGSCYRAVPGSMMRNPLYLQV